MTPTTDPEARPPLLPIALLCLAVSATYVLSMLFSTEGHFIPQVADLYLIAQYARGFAEGHPFQYNPGEAPTTGATSLLHTIFLAFAHFIGFRGEGLIAFAILSGAVFGFLTALEVFAAARQIGQSRNVALLGASLVILNGPLAWSFHYGADIALALFLSTWLFRAWLEGAAPEKPRPNAFVLPACLLAATRPEALVLVAVLVALATWEARRESGRWKLRLHWCLPVLVGFVIPVGMRLMTGSAANTSFSQKLLSSNWGALTAAVFSIDYWSDLIRGVLLGFYPATQRLGLGGGNAPYFAAPLLLVFVFIALLRPMAQTRRLFGFLVAASITIVCVTPTINLGVHSNRYVLFVLPCLLLLFARGLDETGSALDRAFSAPTGAAFRRLSLMAVAFGVLSAIRFALIYADSASSVYRRDEALFDFIRTRLPESATFINNATAIEFRTGRRSINISGVVTPGFSEVLPAETEASAFEVLSRSSPSALPPYLIAPDAYVNGSPAWAALVGGSAIFQTSSLESTELAIYPTRRELIGRQRTWMRLVAPPGFAQVDALNVADPIDERDHAYRWASSAGTRSLFAALKIDKYPGDQGAAEVEVADGGRVIFGFEEMEVRTPKAADVLVGIRTHPEPSARVRHADGDRRLDIGLPQPAIRFSTSRGRTDWMRVSLQPGWNEVALRLPAGLLEGAITRLRIEGRYAAYSYVFFQPGAATAPERQ